MERAGIRTLNKLQYEAIERSRLASGMLMVAPTGSGKTEAALLPIFESLIAGEEGGTRALYITPLRALNRNLSERIQHLVGLTKLTAAVRHGATPARERRRQSANPPDILITTPETLQAILPGKVLQRHLRHVRFVVIDEVHQLAEDRRGTQLAVGLERLRQTIAAFCGGTKPLEILAPELDKRVEYRIEWPRPIDKDFETARDFYISPEAAAGLSAIDDTIDEARSTLVFVNARPLAELLGSRLAMPRPDRAVPHGSPPPGGRRGRGWKGASKRARRRPSWPRRPSSWASTSARSTRSSSTCPRGRSRP